MTSKLKCPFCGEELYDNRAVSAVASRIDIYLCVNSKCGESDKLIGTKELWQALIQSQKDVKTALTAIKEIAEECGCLMTALKSTGFESVVETFDKNIRKKLKQIEHKE